MTTTTSNPKYEALLRDFPILKNKLCLIDYDVSTNEMEEYLSLLLYKIKLHICAIDCLFGNNPHDPFSVIPLTRVCMETFCIISYIKD